jgi:hypothetical protein
MCATFLHKDELCNVQSTNWPLTYLEDFYDIITSHCELEPQSSLLVRAESDVLYEETFQMHKTSMKSRNYSTV